MKRLSVLVLMIAPFTAGVVFRASQATAQEKGDPIASQFKAGLKDLNKPFTMIVRVQVKVGAEEQFEKAFARAIAGTRKEKGNIAYDLNRNARKTSNYLVYERWRDFAALEAHLKTEHITTLLSEIGDLLAMPPEVQLLLPAGE